MANQGIERRGSIVENNNEKMTIGTEITMEARILDVFAHLLSLHVNENIVVVSSLISMFDGSSMSIDRRGHYLNVLV